MTLNRDKLYSILIASCIAGYVWIYLNVESSVINNEVFDVCLIKLVTNIPCPSCGSTRSVIALTNGNFLEALKINPMGFVVALIMLTTPFWVLIDIVTKRKTLFDFYRKIETYLKKPQYSILLILFVIINWIWNISKGI